MMTNLFSSFDPSTSLNLQLNWMSIFMSMIMIPSMFWLIPSRMNFLWLNIINTLHKEFKILMKIEFMKGSTLMFISLFSLIMFNNVASLFPYIFCSTSHLILTLTLALPLWLSFMIYGWINHTMHMFSHLVPLGTPAILMPFMVCIETVSNIIRPGTLAIRLTANMIAGHLLLTLLGNSGSNISLPILSILIVIQLLLLLLESGVALIQAYVFSILSTLYSSEIN
uniref:ATP synthase subunit a n=1 Tax=Melasis buprestoides TaxID=195231 RepID=E3VT75_9COLE|nr:ATP synthase F0 subunit 6 [Melasis buprestoides]ARH54472.1 ATP synthase F0 subunit 6 [Melasis buprestoides]